MNQTKQTKSNVAEMVTSDSCNFMQLFKDTDTPLKEHIKVFAEILTYRGIIQHLSSMCSSFDSGPPVLTALRNEIEQTAARQSWNTMFTPPRNSQRLKPDFYVGLILLLAVDPSFEYIRGDKAIVLAWHVEVSVVLIDALNIFKLHHSYASA